MTDWQTRTLRAIGVLTFGLLAESELALAAPFRIGLNANPSGLVLTPLAEPGAVFVYRASDLTSLADRPEMIFQADAPLTGESWVSLDSATGSANHAFFFAAHWPGRSVDQFGDPESVRGESSPTIIRFTPCNNDCRLAAVDPDVSWSKPLPKDAACRVSGVYGEWRGTGNEDVHEGLDLAAPAETVVLSSRGGVVSCQGTLAGRGDFIVIDHGDGWFSRYCHLGASAIAVEPGQAVLRGATLARSLHTAPGWPVHLHFEVRHGQGEAQWMVADPGVSEDPLRQPLAFSVPAGMRVIELQEAGLTRKHPGVFAYVKEAPDATSSSGTVYLFVRYVEREPGISADYRLGLRSLKFQAEGLEQSAEIRPANSASINRLRVPGTGASVGFARYGPLHAARADPLNWYPYWWEWNTAAYSSAALGPRVIALVAQNYDETTATNVLVFGPQIKNAVWEPLGNRDFGVTLIAHLGSAEPKQTQPDQYQLEVLRADRTPMPEVRWAGTEPENLNLTRVFTTHLEQASYTFHIPESEDPSQMIVRVSSRWTPNLRHEVNQGVVRLAGRAPAAPALVDIPAGTFVMGSPPGEAQRAAWEGPQTLVTLRAAFKLSKYEVTQGEYRAVMNLNPSYFSGVSIRPVEQVSWADALAYCRQLTQLEREAGYLPTGWAYRLPTEAEWEYACRAGTTTAFSYGPALRSGMANFDGRYEFTTTNGTVENPHGVDLGETASVGASSPNAWGLCDMHGNTWEWCLDGWSYFLPGGSVVDPQTVGVANDRVLRGGCWYNEARYCRSAYRIPCDAEYRGNDVGFRVVLAVEAPPPN